MVVYSHCDASGTPFQEKLDLLFQQKRNGFFIELGAYDGLTQSNTAFLEFERGWKGILIEPSYTQYVSCTKNRPNSICIHGACVSNDHNESTIQGDFQNNMPTSSVNGLRNESNSLTQVNAYTLDSLLETYAKDAPIDLISLDVEGYELEVLKGLSLNKVRPRFLLIEVYACDFQKIVQYLEQFSYKIHSNFSNYNKVQCPGWDGTHNDFLFYDSTLFGNYVSLESLTK